jgi:hypothetical protein
MHKKLFNELVESLKQTNEVVRGHREASRTFVVDTTREPRNGGLSCACCVPLNCEPSPTTFADVLLLCAKWLPARDVRSCALFDDQIFRTGRICEAVVECDERGLLAERFFDIQATRELDGIAGTKCMSPDQCLRSSDDGRRELDDEHACKVGVERRNGPIASGI